MNKQFISSVRPLFTALLLFGATTAPAATRSWTGAGSNGNWSTTENWDSGVPVNGDSLYFDGRTSSTRPPYYDSNINNLSSDIAIQDITFTRYHFNLGTLTNRGNRIRLYGDITGSEGGNNTLYLPIELMGATTVDVSTSRLVVMYGNEISGSGSLIKTGDGSLTMRDTKTFSGGITLMEGTLSPAGTTSGTTHFGTGTLTVHGGSVSLLGANTRIHGLAGTGGTVFTSTATVERTLFIDNTNATPVAYAGTLSDGSANQLKVEKSGSGTQILSGTNTYTGATTVSGGTLLIHGSLANTAVSVTSGGTLGGSGVINGNTTVSGTLASGGQAGQLTLAANLTLSGNYRFEAEGFTTVGGALNLEENWTLALVGDGFIAGGSVVLFEFGTLGNFDNTPQFDLSGLNLAVDPGTLSLSLSGNQVVLNGLSVGVIPEPSTVFLLGLSMAGMLLAGRRVSRAKRRSR